MIEYGQQTSDSPTDLQTLMNLLRLVAAVLGIVIIVIGLVYATRMFGAIYRALQSPESFQPVREQWSQAVGGEELNITIAGSTYHVANVAAIAVLGGGAVMLSWIAMALILAGAKVVSWTAGDREAVKRILVHAFGPKKKP